MYWRLHTAIFKQRLDEAKQILLDYKDTIQVINNHMLSCDSLQDITDMPTLALTTIQDARDLSRKQFSKHRTPLVYYNEHQYCVSFWMTHLSSNLPFLNKNGIFLPCGLLPTLDTHIIQFIANNGKIFIRPNNGNKLFTGYSINIDNWEYEINRISEKLNPDSLVVLAPHLDLQDVEWRFWIVDGKVATYSPYSWEEDVKWMEAPSTILDLVNQVAIDEYQLDYTYVVDVVTDMDGFHYINELNATSTSGIYNAPLAPLFESLRSLAYTEFYLYTSDNQT